MQDIEDGPPLLCTSAALLDSQWGSDLGWAAQVQIASSSRSSQTATNELELAGPQITITRSTGSRLLQLRDYQRLINPRLPGIGTAASPLVDTPCKSCET